MYKDFVKALEDVQKYDHTENGALAYRTTGNAVLDAFASLGAMRDSSVEEILDTFYSALYEDKRLAMRLLFYIRDIRGGQGMRRVFRVIMASLATSHTDLVINNLDNFLFFGRGDDYLCLIGTPCEKAMIEEIKTIINDDLKAVNAGGACSLLAKWLPSENTSSKDTRRIAGIIRSKLGYSPKEYRKILSSLRKEIGIVESKMSQGRWDEIDFSKLPAKASMIYSDAFARHCIDSYLSYLKDANNGNSKINAKSLFPVDIVAKIIPSLGYGYWTKSISVKDQWLYNALWNALPNYFGDTEETGICCVDTSGSMSGTPLQVALALGVYCADKCKGPFKGHFFTFDTKPVFQKLKGDTIVDKLGSIKSINSSNTDFEACLQMILDVAILNNLKQSDLPTKLYVISDMQFDEARGVNRWGNRVGYEKPFMQSMKEMYASAGYVLPAIVYWNVRASDCAMFHQTFDGEDCCMVSGYSPSLFKSVIDGTTWEEETVQGSDGDAKVTLKQKVDPIEVMRTTLNNERYDRVYVG